MAAADTATTRTSSAPLPALPTSPPLPDARAPPAQALTAPTALAELIVRAAADGRTRLVVRLDPLELGRVEVAIVRRGDAVAARLVAETPAALDALRHGAPELARALDATPLRLPAETLSFGLAPRDPHAGSGSNQRERERERSFAPDGPRRASRARAAFSTSAATLSTVPPAGIDLIA